MNFTFNKKSQYPLSKKSTLGYTLIEIVIVLGIIAILIGGVIYKSIGQLDVAKMNQVDSDIQSITTQLKLFQLTNRTLPTTAQGLEALVTKPTIEPIPTRWVQLLTEVPKDPWNSPYVYECPGKHNPRDFDVYSLGPDQVESDDDIGNWKK